MLGGIVKSLFGGGSKEKTTKTSSTSDPWKSMPEWLKTAYQDDIAFRNEFLDDVEATADQMGANPRQVLGLSPEEIAAFGDAGAYTTDANQTTIDTLAGLPGMEDIDPGDLDALRAAFESDYTDDVVDTTLSGMQREAQRQKLARDAQTSAIGGTTNARSAVADAVAGDLLNENMGRTEASLRDAGHRQALEAALRARSEDRDFSLSKANFGLDAARVAENLNAARYGRGMTVSGLRGDLGSGARKLQQQGLDSRYTAKQDAQSWLAQMFAASDTKTPPPIGQSTSGTNTREVDTPSPFSQILGTGAQIASIASMFPSDERIKEAVEATTSDLDKVRKLKPYSYAYIDGEGYGGEMRHTGLMAQDVEEAGIEGGVIEDERGVKHVDTYAVLSTLTGAVQELAAKQKGID